MQAPYGFGLHHVQLAMPRNGEEDCRRFYVDVLGLTEIPKPAALAARGGIWVGADSLELHIGVEEPFAPQRKAHPGIIVTDLDALAERLASHGCDVVWDGEFPGMRRFYTADNNGNRLEFLSRRASEQPVPG
ncbi:glyoxalase [Agromyces sp. PvR057]|uniref:glyoxalase n=1 Tax=Agromyces sp. PvR057 TaxID=3156403 RepID=UPI000E27A4AD